jgi:hypothetical protein
MHSRSAVNHAFQMISVEWFGSFEQGVVVSVIEAQGNDQPRFEPVEIPRIIDAAIASLEAL